MVGRQPKLLLLEDLPQRLPQVVAKLKQLHPSGSERVVQGGQGGSTTRTYLNTAALAGMPTYAALPVLRRNVGPFLS
jgi:hypothetical protein